MKTKVFDENQRIIGTFDFVAPVTTTVVLESGSYNVLGTIFDFTMKTLYIYVSE